MASVTNLGEVRTARAAVEAYAQSYVKDLVKFISDESIAYADRAFIIASPARNSDPDLTRDVYRAAIGGSGPACGAGSGNGSALK